MSVTTAIVMSMASIATRKVKEGRVWMSVRWCRFAFSLDADSQLLALGRQSFGFSRCKVSLFQCFTLYSILFKHDFFPTVEPVL